MSVLKRFGSDRRGSTGLLFGLAVLPLFGFVGAAVDYSRASMEQSKLQRAVDGTALALAGEPTANLSSRASAVYDSFAAPGNYVALNPIAVRREGATLIVSRSAQVTNAFTRVIGIPTTTISAEARSTGERIELALVLDNTGSMAELINGTRKIDALKQAAQSLIDTLRARATDRDMVRLSVVPFDTEVRVDPNTYRTKDWIRWTNALSVPERNAWTGYLTDRDQPYDSSDTAPSIAIPGSLFTKRAVSEWGGTLASVRPLTSLYDFSAYNAVKATIGSMQPRGNTNIGLGVAWGTGTLTGSIPLEGETTSDPRALRRFMVVLTDGINTEMSLNGAPIRVRNASNPDPNDPALRAINTHTKAACDTAKGAGIEIFTIRLLDGDAALLGNCASPANRYIATHYYDVQSRQQLQSAFDAIVNSIIGARFTS